MKLSLLTYQIASGWELQELLCKSKQLGFEAVELRVELGHKHGVELSLDKEGRRKVKELSQEYGMPICGLSSGCRYDSIDKKELQANIIKTKQLIELCSDIGAFGLKVFGNNFHEAEGIPKEQTIEQVAAAVRECALFAGDYNIDLRFEMHGDFNAPEYCVKVIELAAVKEHLCLIYNSDPRDVKDGSIRDTFSKVQKYIGHVHLKDLCDPGFPYKELITLLKSIGYGGYCSAEIPEAGAADTERILRYYVALWNAYKE